MGVSIIIEINQDAIDNFGNPVIDDVFKNELVSRVISAAKGDIKGPKGQSNLIKNCTVKRRDTKALFLFDRKLIEINPKDWEYICVGNYTYKRVEKVVDNKS
jgi:hypothetical protein